MDGRPIRVLMVDDDEDDFVLIRDLVSELKGNVFALERAKDYDAALEAMRSARHDVYLLDYRLGARNGLELLAAALQHGCKAPIIVLTGQDDRAIDIEAMRAGAADYLTKGQINATLLERSIRYAIERQRDREALRQARDDLEERVQERTAALQTAIEALQAEVAERRRAEQALKDADVHKDEFLAMLAHELRNPLAPIRNGLHILRMPGVDAPTTQRVYVMMEQQVRNLTRLVDDLLDVSRITRGKIHLHNETVDLARVIDHAVETVRPLVELAKHKLAVTLPKQPLLLDGDPTRLEQIITNLLGNAAKYTEPGGQIRLTVTRENADVLLRVRDTGIGISSELLPRIFDMFTQGDRALDRTQGGLGIGLTLVRRLVELHGGSVHAYSDGPGTGSEFLVRLPAQPEPPRAGPEANRTFDVPNGWLRVLVVEDEMAVAEMLVMLLKLWGHRVEAVHDGSATLAAVQSFQPEVVLCDIGLPGMNGYQLARQVRQHNGACKPILVAITGYGQDEDRRLAQDAGFDHHMTKPVDPGALERLLASCAAARRAP